MPALDEDQRAVGSLPTVGLVLLVLVLVTIGVGSVILLGRTNRQFNMGLVVAAAVVLVVIAWIVVATRLAAANIEDSRTEGTAKFGQLAKARILAQQARTDETLQLIARGDITAGEKSFYGHIDELGTLLDAAPAAAKDGVQKWIASHRKQIEVYERGDYDAAVAQAIGPDPDASAAQFADVESSLRDEIERTRATLRDRVSAAGAMAGVESHGDARADGCRCVGGRRRLVAATQGVPVKTRIVMALLALRSPPPDVDPPSRRCRCRSRRSSRGHPVRSEVTTAPAAASADCDREASLRPGPLPSPGAMPPGSTMAAIAERGRLIVGVDQNTYLFGFRNPSTGQLEGFDIDLAREIARSDLRRSRPHPVASGRCDPTGIGVAVG